MNRLLRAGGLLVPFISMRQKSGGHAQKGPQQDSQADLQFESHLLPGGSPAEIAGDVDALHPDPDEVFQRRQAPVDHRAEFAVV